MYIGKLYRRTLDTKKFFALPEAATLLTIMTAINDFTLHDTIVSNFQTQRTIHRRDNDLSEDEFTILEAQLDLLSRHQFGLIWECIELTKKLDKEAPTIVVFLNSFPEIKNIYEIVKLAYQSTELVRIRNNLSFHFGLDHKASLHTIELLKTGVITTEIGEESWYEIASESQAHLLTRPITKLVSNELTEKESFQKSSQKGLDMMALKLNVVSLFKSIVENFIEDCYDPSFES